jgi:hypothetical protein
MASGGTNHLLSARGLMFVELLFQGSRDNNLAIHLHLIFLRGMHSLDAVRVVPGHKF